MPGNLKSVQRVQQRIAGLAQRPPDFAFFSLAHHIDLDWLEAAYHRTRKDGAAGIDDVTGKQYAEKLHDNLLNLLDRLKSGTYKAPPVKRKHIPKGTSNETRPIGIPAFEDKIVQRAVVMLLEPIYEHDFYDSSFGFRPRRSAHQALQAVWDATMKVYGGMVLEVDIRKFSDTIDHRHLQEFVSRWVRDGVLRRLIGKWLNYGYFGITGNDRSLESFLRQVQRGWQRWLNRRNCRRNFTWEKFHRLHARYPLPTPKTVHSVFRRK